MKIFKKAVILILALSILASVFAIGSSAASLAYGAGTVSATSLNIRSGPGTEYSRVTVVSKGTVLVILEKSTEKWYKINYNGNVGYACSDYLTNVLTAENFKASGTVTSSDVRMRSAPNTNSAILSTYASNTGVAVIGINNGWYKVQHNGLTGYIRSDLMEITGAPVYTAASSSDSGLGQQIANFALQYLGYNYVYGAESPSTGFDCSGLAYYVYGQFGYRLERCADTQYACNGYSVSKDSLQQGDLVFFSSNGYSVTHVGIYIGDRQFIHASTSSTGVIISSLDSSYYQGVWWGAKRIV